MGGQVQASFMLIRCMYPVCEVASQVQASADLVIPCHFQVSHLASIVHLRDEGVHKWKEHILPVSNHICAFMSILILTFWCSFPMISHVVHPLAGCPFRNWFLQAKPFLHLQCVQEQHNIPCAGKRPFGLKM